MRRTKYWAGARRVALAAGVTAILGAVAVGQGADREPPPIPVPDYAVPEQNAFDDYQAAIAAEPNPLPNPDPVGQIYQEGRTAPDLGWAALEPYQPVLEALREGLPKVCLMPEVTSFDMLLPYLAKFRHFTRVLCVEGWLHEQDGDTAAALGSYLDAMKLGQDAARGGPLIHKLVSIACETIALKETRACLAQAQPDEGTLADLVTRLQTFEQHEVPLSDTLAFEHHATQQGIDELPDDPQKLAELLGQVNGEAPSPLLRQPLDREQIKREMAWYYAQAITLARLPYPQVAGADPTVGHNPVVQMLAPAVNNVRRKDVEHQADLRGTILLAALELYHVRHGAYPAALQDLTPDCLPALPLDPFAEKPFCYRTDPDGYTLYSVGPNLTDDGGWMAPNRGDRDTQGDLVYSLVAWPE